MKRLVPALALASVAFSALPAHAASTDEPVLGSPSYLAPQADGYGTAHPVEVFNGGDPAGDAGQLVWEHWGASSSRAHGSIPIFRPHGGYYAKPGRLLLRATRLGSCPDGTYAYTRLWYRVSRTPDGPIGKRWHRWNTTGDICQSP